MNARIVGWTGAFVILVCLASAHAQSGGGFDLTWNTFDGGGMFRCMLTSSPNPSE